MLAQSASSVSSFFTLPSPSAVTFYPGHDDLDTPSLQSSDSSLESSATLCTSASLPALLPPSLYGVDSSESELTVVAPKLVEVKVGGKKKRYVWLRAIKKAATVAVPRSLRLRRARPVTKEALQTAFAAPADPVEDDPAGISADAAPGLASNTSNYSLAAVHGSPTENTRAFPPAPPFPTRDSVMVAKCHEARTRRPPIPDAMSPATLARLKWLARVLLFFPYVTLLGFVPFLAPTHLSYLTFSPWAGRALRPLSPMEVFAYHSKMLPWHIGASLSVLALVVWRLGSCFPGLAVSLLAALLGRTMWAWGTFDTTAGAGEAKLGIDDRATVFWLLRGFVLGDLIYSMDDFSKWCEEEEGVDEGEEDGEMETLERDGGMPGHPVDFVIRLKDRPHECLRIVVDCADSY